MKILLTTLHSKFIHASLALPYLKVFCQDICPDIEIREYSVNEPKDIVLAQIMSIKPDVVCFSVYLWNRLATLELVNCIKLIDERIKIVLGGPEVSFEDDSFFASDPVDAIIRGEGELPLKYLLSCWDQGISPAEYAGLHLRNQGLPGHNSLLSCLDDIPSPFDNGLVDFNKGMVYFETSRGCPYSCSFCMSALDSQVRSFSMPRIKSDLLILMEAEVKLIKFVDRTFNFNNSRAREIFSFILEHNISSQFHFEIGAHLLDDETIELLAQVPDGMFQFEIGVQSTLPETLKKVSRVSILERLVSNVQKLKNETQIHLHLDLIAGLPDETYQQFISSMDTTLKLGAGHLQIEPVKILPGAPLRNQATQWGIVHDPKPPYTILKSNTMSFDDLERLRGIGRLLDIFVNSSRFERIFRHLQCIYGSVSGSLEALDIFWREEGLYKQSHSLKGLYLLLDKFLRQYLPQDSIAKSRECLARDYAMHERLMTGNAPDFFNLNLTGEENNKVREYVKSVIDDFPRTGKVQYCAAVFNHLEVREGRALLVYFYFTNTGEGMKSYEHILDF